MKQQYYCLMISYNVYTQYAEVTRAYIKAILLLLGADDNNTLDTAINGIFELERRLAEVCSRL